MPPMWSEKKRPPDGNKTDAVMFCPPSIPPVSLSPNLLPFSRARKSEPPGQAIGW